MSKIEKLDPQVAVIIKGEQKRQQEGLEMIASENYASEAVLEASGSIFTNKYAEGYPGKRYYGGQEFTDQIETLTQERALAMFELSPEEWKVNVQPYSGSPANTAVYFALANFGDTLMGMNLSQGGHLTHGHKVSFSGKAFNFVQYDLKEKEQTIDYDQVYKLAKEVKPKIIVSGATAYPRTIDFKRFYEIAQEVGAIHMADISHIAGLVVGGVHPSPFPYVDVVTTTTHKTLRGPRGAMIISRPEFATKIDKAIFPGLQGGPHMHLIAAKAVAFGEALKPEFKKYAAQIIKNMKAFCDQLSKDGFSLISGGSDNHLCLIDLRSKGLTGKDFEVALDSVGITVNKNSIPGDPLSPTITSGVRVGSAALTTRGFKEPEFIQIAKYFAQVAASLDKPEILQNIHQEIIKLALKFPVPGIV